MDVPRRIGTWEITSVTVKATYPDGSVWNRSAVRVGNVWVATIESSLSVGTTANGFAIFASGVDENGDVVSEGYTLGVGDVEILPADTSVHPGLHGHNLTIWDEPTDDPKVGDAYYDDHKMLLVFNGSAYEPLGGGIKEGVNLITEDVTLRGSTSQTITQLGSNKVAVASLITGENSKLEFNNLNVGTKSGTVSVGPGLTMSSVTQSDGGTLSTISLDGSKVQTAADVEAYAMPIGGKARGDFQLGPNESCMLWDYKSGYLGIIGEGNSLWMDEDTFVELEDGWEQLKKVVSGGKTPVYQTLPEYLGENYAAKTDLAVRMDLVGDGTAASPYAVQLAGVTKTFAEVKTLAETRNAVIRHGRGTYRVTYVGASEMMWDCTGTVQGEVQTGMIHMSADGNVVQLVSAKALALKSDIGNGKITINQGGVKKGEFTLNQNGDATVDLAAGGGGSSKCVLHIYAPSNSNQSVKWTVGTDVFETVFSGGVLIVNKNGVAQTGHGQIRDYMAVADGVVQISDGGYPFDCTIALDGTRVTDYANLDTTGHNALYVYFSDCLEQDTLITMADGSTKRVADLWAGDKVLSLNPDTLQLEEDEVSDCDGGILKSHNLTDIWTFEDGTALKTVKPHQFYNVRTGRMEYIADFRIGDRVRKADGTETALVSHDLRRGLVYHNTLYTRKNNNYFANGILTGNRHSVKWGWLWRKNHGGEA